MKIEVKGVLEIHRAPYSVLQFCRQKLTYSNPLYTKRKMRRQPVYGIEKHISSMIYEPSTEILILPKTFLDKLHDFCILQKIPVEIVHHNSYQHTEDVGIQWNSDITLRDYQEDAIVDIFERSGILVAPAGSGKTVMGMHYIAMYDYPAVWLTHTVDLFYQARERAKKFLVNTGEIGMIGDGILSYGDKKLLIVIIQTLSASPHLIETINKICNIAVVDEAHHIPSDMFMNVVAKLQMKYILGLTATPERKDELECLMFDAVGNILHTVDRTKLYEYEQLIKPEVRFIYTDFVDEQNAEHNIEINSIKAGGENFSYANLLSALHKDVNRINLIAETILSYISDKNYQLVLSESIEYCYILQKKVNELILQNNLVGVQTVVFHGHLPKYSWYVVDSKQQAQEMYDDNLVEEIKFNNAARRWMVKIANFSDEELAAKQITKARRAEILKDVVNKKIHIIFATTLAREGLDIPHLNIGHTVSPKQGDMQKRADGASVEQEIGRIMRPDPSNADKKAVWIDYVDEKCSMFKTQYYNRRKVYKRLQLAVPKKRKTKMESVEEFLTIEDLFI